MDRKIAGRRKRIPLVEGLESRGLLSSGVPTVSHAAIETIASLIPAITGTIHGTITQITPLSANSQEVFYTARGKANIIGDGKGSGHHVIVSKPLKNGGSKDIYKNGLATIAGTTDTVAIHYTGQGHTNANGSFTANWKGTARSVAGSHAGIGGSFSARISGPSRTGDFMIKITIKV